MKPKHVKHINAMQDKSTTISNPTNMHCGINLVSLPVQANSGHSEGNYVVISVLFVPNFLFSKSILNLTLKKTTTPLHIYLVLWIIDKH